MAVGDNYYYIDGKSIVVQSRPIVVGSNVLCMRHNQGLIRPVTVGVGANVVIIPTSAGKLVMRGGILIDETQYWYDPEFQNGDIKYYSSEFSGGTYKLTVTGWYTEWDDYDSHYICDESITGKPKFISCCRDELQLTINGTEYGIGTMCTTRDLSNKTGYGMITIPHDATVGIKFYDDPYEDNHGNTTFQMEGPI